MPLLVVALLVPTLVGPNGVWALAAVSVFTAVTVMVTVRVGVLDDRQFVLLGSGGMAGVAVSAFVIVDPASTTAVGAMLAVVPAIAASGSSRHITVALTAVAIALATAVCIDETVGTVRLVAVGATVTTVLVPTVLMASLRSRVSAVTSRLEDLADTDPLTRLLNRRGLTARAAAMLDQACISAVPLLVCLVDIDHFKSVNDQFGHAVGDDVLVEVAATLHAVAGPDALVARLGGEEFLVVGLTSVMGGVEGTILAAMRETGTVTVSVGVVRCTVVSDDEVNDPWSAVDSLTATADRALYAAKSSGRDQAAYVLAESLSWSGAAVGGRGRPVFDSGHPRSQVGRPSTKR
ncbi:GGDEF domain-containing protein [Rhodococcus sp. BP-332]|uniref:GGDEF domain-containing protein n=1 Tax=Rhodococcus sp. BP-332 TaxID=2739447 RepID=UPI001C9A4D64|nr:GGDEF domain-containing protein [Rhodococcus sp. BP-332]MBY6679318.1 GGDEF domain-containing protein [Rhodococcus sp. BP-332]